MVRMLNRVKTSIANLYFNFLSVEEKLGYMFLSTSLKNIRPIVILPAVDTVMNSVVSKLKKKTVHGAVYNGILNHVEVSVIQTHMGSPAAAVIMEVIKNCACKAAIRIDFCGGLKDTWYNGQIIQTGIEVGSLVIPKSVVLSDGTSLQYLQEYTAQIATHPLFHALPADASEHWIYPNVGDRYWAVDCDEILYALFQKIIPERMKREQEDRLWSSDALFCENEDAINTWKLHGCNSVDMESCAIYLLGALFNIPVISVLGVSNLTILEEPSMLKSKKIHPAILQGLDDAVNLLQESLPLIQSELVR
jgi:uridine phosphorylase